VPVYLRLLRYPSANANSKAFVVLVLIDIDSVICCLCLQFVLSLFVTDIMEFKCGHEFWTVGQLNMMKAAELKMLKFFALDMIAGLNHSFWDNKPLFYAVNIVDTADLEMQYPSTSQETVICERHLRHQCQSIEGCQHYPLPYQWQVMQSNTCSYCTAIQCEVLLQLQSGFNFILKFHLR
jgi:hypothetical protein